MTAYIAAALAFVIGAVLMFFAFVISTARHKRESATRKGKHTKKLEFSKFIVALYAFACIAWITADYVLAFMYRQPVNTEVTVTLTTTVVIALLGYYGKAAFEKASRNKYKLDENGMPFNRGEGE